MEKLSTYSLLGLPESLATAIILVWLSLSLAPWFGGTELGPLKVPKLSETASRWLRVVAPVGLVVFALGFVKLWPAKPQAAATLSYSQYLEGFFDTSKSQAVRGEPYLMNELEVRQLRGFLGGTRWDGGANWGTITFDESGRRANYTNQSGRYPGALLIQGVPPGTVPILIGEWQQHDRQSGRIMLLVPAASSGEQLVVRWGPSFAAESTWRKAK